VAAALWPSETAVCPSRYASIRTVSESTFGDSVHYEIRLLGLLRCCNLPSGLSSRMDQVRNSAVTLCEIRSAMSGKSRALRPFRVLALAGLSPPPVATLLDRLCAKLPGLRTDVCCAVARRSPRSPTNCVVAPRAFSPQPPLLVSWRSCLRV
jgi:hypothetical protein